MTKCPYCGRKLREHERYCDFCEQDIGKHVDKSEKPDLPKRNIKGDIEKLKKRSGILLDKIKKRVIKNRRN